MPNFEYSKISIPSCSEEISSPTKNGVFLNRANQGEAWIALFLMGTERTIGEAWIAPFLMRTKSQKDPDEKTRQGNSSATF
jgi:hypothetical protein